MRLVLDQQGKHDSQGAAIISVSSKISCAPETLRKWVGQAERDLGRRTGLTSSERERLKTLEPENRELHRPNEVQAQGLGLFRPGGARPPTEAMTSFIDAERRRTGSSRSAACCRSPRRPTTRSRPGKRTAAAAREDGNGGRATARRHPRASPCRPRTHDVSQQPASERQPLKDSHRSFLKIAASNLRIARHAHEWEIGSVDQVQCPDHGLHQIFGILNPVRVSQPAPIRSQLKTFDEMPLPTGWQPRGIPVRCSAKCAVSTTSTSSSHQPMEWPWLV